MTFSPLFRLIVVSVLAALLASPLAASSPFKPSETSGVPLGASPSASSQPSSTPAPSPAPAVLSSSAAAPAPSSPDSCSFGCLGLGPAGPEGTSAAGGVSSWQNLTSSAGPAPSPRQGAAVAFDAAPGAGYLLLYGGEGAAGLDHDTWINQGGAWRNVTSTACGAVCPPRLAYAAMAYDPADQSVVLVGGLNATCPTGCGEQISNVAYLWTNGQWRSSVAAGYYAFGASLAWDANDGCLLAFGGTSSGGPANLGAGYGESACFNSTAGNWSYVSGVANAPSPRWGAAMANTSTGIDLLFGGDSLGGPLNDTWEFYNGSWYPVEIGGISPPARAYAALAESPAASLGVAIPGDSAILFEGQSSGAPLDDTWLFSGGPPSHGHAYGNWTEDTTLPTPPSAWGPAASVDFTNSSVITFGGAGAGHDLGSTWAYFHPVVIVSSNESEYRASTTAAFTARAAGGLPPYTYTWSGLPTDCVSADVAVLDCTPSGFGIYNVTVGIADSHGRTASAWMTVQVDPQSTVLTVSSEYAGYFYTGMPLNNTFGVVSSVWGNAPTQVTGVLAGVTLSFAASGGGWDASANMGNVTPGGELRVTITYSNWTVHGTFPVQMIETPSWMQSFLDFPGGLLLFRSQGSGPWNHTYEYAEEMGWSLASLIAFSIPVPGFSGSYSLLPTSLAYFNFTSSGSAGLAGELASSPSLTIGPVTLSASIPGLKFSSSVNITGTFTLQSLGPGISTIDFVSATASISVSAEADFTISIFPAATPEGSLGLQAVISVTPSIMLTVVLGPGTAGDSDFLPGLSLIMKDLLVNLGFQVGITIQFGVDDLFEIGATGTLGIAVLFQTLQPHLAGVWVNASLSGFVQFLCFSVSFTLWSGNLYTWTADPPAALAHPARGPSPASVFVPWGFASRYYNGSEYNRVVWNASTPNGTAIQDLYPNAAPSIASAGDAATIAYTYDDVAQNESSALGLRAYSFDPVSRTFQPMTIPAVASSVSFSPQLLDLANGSSVAVFSTVPTSEMATRIPANVPGFELESTQGSGSDWSPPRELQSWGYPLDYRLDTCGASATPTAAVLVSPVVDPNGSTSERLLQYDLATGGVTSNVSVVGLTDLDGFDCAGGWVSGTSASGEVGLYDTSTGLSIVVNALPPVGAELVGATPVGGAPQDVALEYRGPSGVEAILFDLEPETSVAVAGLPANVTGIEAFASGGGFYLFAGTPNAVLPYSFTSTGVSATLPPIAANGLQRFTVARTSYGFVVLEVPSYGSQVAPMENLTLSYLALETPPPASTTTASGACRFAGLGCGTSDAVFAGVLAVLILAVIAVVIRSRRPGGGSPPAAPVTPPSPNSSSSGTNGPDGPRGV